MKRNLFSSQVIQTPYSQCQSTIANARLSSTASAGTGVNANSSEDQFTDEVANKNSKEKPHVHDHDDDHPAVVSGASNQGQCGSLTVGKPTLGSQRRGRHEERWSRVSRLEPMNQRQ